MTDTVEIGHQVRDLDERLRVLNLQPTLREACDYSGRARWLFRVGHDVDDRYVEVTSTTSSGGYLVVFRDGDCSSCHVFQTVGKWQGSSTVLVARPLDDLVMEIARHLDVLCAARRKS